MFVCDIYIYIDIPSESELPSPILVVSRKPNFKTIVQHDPRKSSSIWVAGGRHGHVAEYDSREYDSQKLFATKRKTFAEHQPTSTTKLVWHRCFSPRIDIVSNFNGDHDIFLWSLGWQVGLFEHGKWYTMVFVGALFSDTALRFLVLLKHRLPRHPH